MLDERWIRSLHVETMREEDLHAERDSHVLFQASTIGALIEGAYEGDLSFAELAEHGDWARPRGGSGVTPPEAVAQQIVRG